MNMESPHVDFVIAAYAVAFAGIFFLLLRAVVQWRGVIAALQKLPKNGDSKP